MRTLQVFQFLFFSVVIVAQTHTEQVIRRVEMRVDTNTFNTTANMARVGGESHLCFTYSDENEVAEVRLFARPGYRVNTIDLQNAADYELLDSIVRIRDEYFQFRVRFRNLTKTQFTKFIFTGYTDSGPFVEEIKLQPCTYTTFNLAPAGDELFVGEEKEIEIITSNIENIRFSNEWTSDRDIHYRIIERAGRLFIILSPNAVGLKKLDVKLRSHKPRLENGNRLVYDLSPIVQDFFVKASRLQYLNLDRKEVTLDEKARTEGILVQLDNSRLLVLNKTYRVENQEEPGGPLIAEIFTRNLMANNRVMCLIRLYNYHRSSDGYLYIKDGDQPRFITSFSVTPKTEIERISILREGKDWVQNLNIYPGEMFDLRIQGQGMHKASFVFEDLEVVAADSLIRNESQQLFKLRVPMDINKRQVTIYNHAQPTGNSLNVREYMEPRPLDFVNINYGDLSRAVTFIRGPVLYNKTIRDVVFTFNRDKIDSDDRLYGKQYLKFEVQVTGMKNELIEMKTIDNIVVCPSTRSPRYEFYGAKDCNADEVSLNRYIRRKTHDLDEWSRIKVTVQHDPAKHGSEGANKEIEIVLKRAYKFDIDVSFPTGLITVYKTDKKDADGNVERVTEYGNLWGVSMAMIAQFSFYHPDKIAKLRPYRFGAGFLALNAFNLSSSNTNQDLAFVVLGSLYPTSRDNRLSFPLFAGGGYKLLDRSWVFLIGPGIRVRL